MIGNSSIGGFHLTAKLPVEAGTIVSGILRVDGADGFPFTAVVVRKDDASDAVGFRFQNLSPLAVSKLDRALARRLVRRP